MPYSVIDDYVMISMGVNIAHHTILSKGVFLSTGNNIGASLLLEDNVYCGMSVTIVTGVKKIGKNSLIGAGAVVLKDVDSNSIMAGIPAKLLRYKK